ncbi:MAG: SPFH domain-containing protein [Eubacteriales bacterium]
MGLIKALGNVIAAGSQAVTSVVADQYLEYFTCDSLGTDVLVKRGAKKIKNGSNKGDSDVITNGSKIAVPEGTALLLIDNGKVTDFTTESGLYTWDASSAPSMFGSEGLKTGFVDSCKEILNRFKAGGVINSEQRVYFVNMLENVDNKFGTASPMPYDDPTYMGIYIRLNGTFSFKIENPVAFFQAIAGNVTDIYDKSTLMTQAKTEFTSKFVEALNKCGAGGDGIKYNRLPSEQTRFTKYMNEVLDEEWLQGRGMVVVSVAIGGITPDDESRKRIQEFDRDILLSRNPDMLAARMGAASAEAMVGAANNTAGAATGFMGMGMVGGMGQMGGAAGAPALGYFAGQQAQQAQQAQAAGTAAGAIPVAGAAVATSAGWTCSSCGHSGNTGKFCAECGKPKPEPVSGWDCSCGNKGNTGKFCSECGMPQPAAVKGCSSCGWTPKNGENTPKFCPECGKQIV